MILASLRKVLLREFTRQGSDQQGQKQLKPITCPKQRIKKNCQNQNVIFLKHFEENGQTDGQCEFVAPPQSNF